MKKKETDVQARSTNRRRANEPSLQLPTRRLSLSSSSSCFIQSVIIHFSSFPLPSSKQTRTHTALVARLSLSTALHRTFTSRNSHNGYSCQFEFIIESHSNTRRRERTVISFAWNLWFVEFLVIWQNNHWEFFLGNDYKKYGEYIRRENNVPLTIKKIYKLLDERKAYRRISDYFHRERYELVLFFCSV